jgi:MFS family permease
MSNRRTAWLAWALCGLTICVAIVSFVADLLSPHQSISVFQLANVAFFVLAMPAVFGIVGALIVSRQPRNTIGWLLMVPVGSALLDGPIQLYLQRIAPTAPTPTLPLLLMVWFSGWSWLLLLFPLLHIPLLFPNGQPPTPRWRWVSVAAIAWAMLFVLIITFMQPINANNTPELILDNPIGILSQDTADSLGNVWAVGLMALVLLCVVAPFVRYRRASETERKQIEWLLYAGALFLVVYAGGNVNGLNESTSLAGDIFQLFFGLSLLAFPVAIGIAILRYRLYDIDIIIRRTLVYSVLTLTLGLVYIGCIIVSRTLVAPYLGGSELAIVASTLAIAALFNPLRKRIQTLIDKRFYRRKYDAAKVLTAFGVAARDETDLEQLTAEMLRVVDETVQPEFVGLWLREPGTDKQRGAM